VALRARTRLRVLQDSCSTWARLRSSGGGSVLAVCDDTPPDILAALPSACYCVVVGNWAGHALPGCTPPPCAPTLL